MRCLCWLCVLFSIATYGNPDPGIRFIENKKQWRKPVQFSARIKGGSMTLLPGKIEYMFLDQQRIYELHDQTHHRPELMEEDNTINGVAIAVEFIGADTHSRPMPFGKFAEYYNYYTHDPSRWSSGVPAYAGVWYRSFYPGIDLKIYSEEKNPKYDFVIGPFADPSQISFSYVGVENLEVDNGDLIINSSFVRIIEKKPIAYQVINGERIMVKCEYRIANGRVGFHFPEQYDPCYELTIDPLLIFSTYSGSEADNWGSTATPAEHGNMYSAGATIEINLIDTFPATAGVFQKVYGGSWDIGILKYDSSGRTLLYASYLGGSLAESAHSLVMDSNEDLLVLGTTSSSDFPVTTNAFQQNYAGGMEEDQVYEYEDGSDLFVARISSDGKILKACTYLGGTANDGLNPTSSSLYKNYGDGLRGDIITDDDHNVYFSSVTSSANFPIVFSGTTYRGGLTDAILVKMSPDLSSVIFSMFVGGSGTDAAHTIKLDQARNVFLAGGTTSLNFPVTAGAAQGMLSGDVDGWIAKVAASGNAIINATFTGRSNYDQIFFLDLDPHEDVYVFGQTTSPDFIKKPDTVFHEVNGGQFIQKFSNNLGSLMISTVFGAGRGVPDISPTAFLVNDCQNVFLAGWGGVLNNFNLGRPDWGKWTGSNTTGLTITAEALQKTTTGNDFYLMVLDRSLSNLLYATWLGGKQSVTHVDGGTSRFDKNGIVYQAVCSSCGGFDNDFPTTPGAHSRTNNSNNCNNLAFKLDLSSLKAIIQPNSLQLNMPGITNICFPDTLMFENLSLGGERYLWDMGDGRQFATDNQKPFQYFYKQPGIYTVWLKAVDAGTCKIRDSTFVKITVDRVEAVVSDDVTICENTSALLHASGAATYAWTSEDGTFQATGPDVTVSPGQQTDYYVSMTDDNSDCILKDTITVDVIPLIVPEFDVLSNGECTPVPAITVRSTTVLEEGDQFYIDFGDGYTADTEIAEHTYEHDGVYTVKLVGIRDFCVSEKIISVPAFRLRVPNVITPEVKDGINDTFKVLFGNEGMVKPGDFGFNVSLTVYNRWGRKLYHAYPYNNDWNADGLEPGIYFFELKVDRYTFCKSWLEVIR